jgi:simple sugar transport system permease protein
MARSAFGFRPAMAGVNPMALPWAGVAIDRMTVVAPMLVGRLGGLAGATMLQGKPYALNVGFSSGHGVDGLVVGLLARGSVPRVIARKLA